MSQEDEAMYDADVRAAKRLRGDPATQAWLDAAYRSLADGSFDREVATQPSPLEAAELFKSRRS